MLSLFIRRIARDNRFQIAQVILYNRDIGTFHCQKVYEMPKRARDSNITILRDENNTKQIPCIPIKKAKLDNIKKMGSSQSKGSTKKNTSKNKVNINSESEVLKKKNPVIIQSNHQTTCSANSQSSKNLDWTPADYIHELNFIDRYIAEKVVKLFEDDNTIPFIARYRKDETCGLDADQLRVIKESYDRSKSIKRKADSVLKLIQKSGKLTKELNEAVKSTKSLKELEHIHSLYKGSATKTLAEKARDIGLGPIAEKIIHGDEIPHIKSLINRKIEGLQDENNIKNGIINILADIIHKDERTFDKINKLLKKTDIQIVTKKNKVSKVNATSEETNDGKYAMYYDWSSSEKNIKSYHVLAINRAEAEKIIKVQIVISEKFELLLKKNILNLYECPMNKSSFHYSLINEAYDNAYKKFKLAIGRQVRHEMSEKAQEESMKVFAMNLKQLLLTQPLRGNVILGIDPGFKHGCKLAVISQLGEVLETATIYPHFKKGNSQKQAADTFVCLMLKHKCSVVALGNGTACRETEMFLSDLIKSNRFGKQEIIYRIVDESGSSIYSCSDEAKSEFPDMDYNVISAVSIARRLQDPLGELVKVSPRNLGVGMYQHDIPSKQLMDKLDEIVTEVVSFVGVDLNTASRCLLRRVAGLSDSRAASIIEWRRENGSFVNRNQLQKVKGIGVKIFEQCAGFIRVLPETAKLNFPEKSRMTVNSQFNYFDQTWIHPETYPIANAFVKACEVNLKELGSKEFISKVKAFASKDFAGLAKKLQTNIETLEVIVNGLTMEKGTDIRNQGNAPLFKKSLRTMDDVTVGSLLSGEVRNVTHFGVFVDVGLKKQAMICIKNLNGEVLNIGQRVDVKVEHIDKERDRIRLSLVKI